MSKLIQVGQYWAIATTWLKALRCVEIRKNEEDKYSAIGIYELHSGRLSIALSDPDIDLTDLSPKQARELASLLEVAAAISADWDSWMEGDRNAE